MKYTRLARTLNLGLAPSSVVVGTTPKRIATADFRSAVAMGRSAHGSVQVMVSGLEKLKK